MEGRKCTKYEVQSTKYKVRSTKYGSPLPRIIFLGTLYLVLNTPSFSQQQNLPLNREVMLHADKLFNTLIIPDTGKTGSHVFLILPGHTRTHTGFRPLVESHSISLKKLSGYKGLNWDRNYTFRDLLVSEDIGIWVEMKRPFEHLITIHDTNDKFHLTIDPLFDFQLGRDTEDTTKQKAYINTRGLLVRGDLGEKFSFESSFYENQAFFPSYIDSFNLTYGVVPGQGRWKPFFKKKKGSSDSTGYDFAMASGYVSYSPNKHFNFQAGHGKHAVGDGYRSLLLSDNAFNYPYVRITSTFGRFQYTNLYTAFMNMTSGAVPYGTERLFQKKAGVFQYLSWSAHERLQLGLFQGTIAPGSDFRNKQHLEPFFFNPVLFLNAAKYKFNDPYNVLAGATLKVKLTKRISFYAQYMLDNLPDKGPGSVQNKQGFQAGMKYFDVFGIKNLHLQLEYNQVRPYAYSKDTLVDAWTHYNQALAHPLGANFVEFNSFLDYRLGPFFTEFRFTGAVTGKDSAGGNFGSDIFQSSQTAWFGPHSDINVTCQGLSTTLFYSDLKIGYTINPAVNSNISMGFTARNFSNEQYETHLFFLYITLRTSLTNRYYDF
jgi:hypothetical protein